jgi:4-hydroxy-2-oxoheptanedioate aldolase
MRKSRIKSKFRRGLPAMISALHLADPTMYETLSLMGIDGIWLDMEHHSTTVNMASELIRATRVGLADVVARPAKGEFMRMGRMLEMGASAIMYPRCDSAEEAAEVVRWSKFAPMGQRGIDGANPDNPYLLMPLPEYIKEANEETLVIIQIEDTDALDEVDEIAAIDGVDVIMLGPGDFSILNGFPGQMDHPDLLDAKKRIASATKAHGKEWGCPVGSVDAARDLLEMGARFIPYGADIVYLLAAYGKQIKDFSEIGFDFSDAPYKSQF